MTVLADMRTRLASAERSASLRYLPISALVIDLGIIAGSMGLAVLGRSRWELEIFSGSDDIAYLSVIVPLILGCWLLMIYLFGGYRADVFGAGVDEYKRVFNASVVTAGLVGVACYLARFQLSRGFFFLAFLVGVPALMIGRNWSRRALHRVRERGGLQQSVLIAGSAANIDEVAHVLSRESWLGYQVVGAVTPLEDDREETPAGVPVMGDIEELTALVEKTSADVIFFAGGGIDTGKRMRRAVWELEQLAVQVIVAPSVTDISHERVRVRPVGGLPLMHIDPPTWANAARIGKRLFDLVSAALLLAVLSPLILASAIAIKVHDGGPVLFRQTRVGRNGGVFACLKFRSMVVDAEQRLAELHAVTGYEHGLFKMESDPG